MTNSEKTYSIKKDYNGENSLVIIPVGKFNISNKYQIGDLTIYPINTVNTEELFEAKVDLDFAEVKEDFFNSAFIVFPIIVQKENPFGNFTLEQKNQLLNSSFSQAEEVLNIFKYIYCNLDKSSILTQKAGYINNIYSGALIYYPHLGMSDFLIDKYKVNTEFIGKGLIVELKEIKDILDKHSVILDEDCGEVGNITKHALQLYVNIVEASSYTNKYVQALSLIEYLTNPFEFEKMQKLKGHIIAFSVDNKKSYHELSERFKYLSALKDEQGIEIGIRTNLVHNGKLLEQVLDKPYEPEFMIKELQYYICNYLEACFENYKMSWEKFVEKREQRKKEIENNLNKFEGKYVSDTLVLIDFEFFNKALKEIYQMYPQYTQRKFDMGSFLYRCVSQVGIERKGFKIPFQFIIDSNVKIYNDAQNKNIIDYEQFGVNTPLGEFDIYVSQKYGNYFTYLEDVLYEYTLERNYVLVPPSKFDNIILISDRNGISKEFFEGIEQSVKQIFLGRLDEHRTTAYPNFPWFNIQFLFLNMLGIELWEEAKPDLIFEAN
ncbi:hypothetical protein [Lysinibacillus sp. SGAir0095]|uniref:hypothetical protein n=1 Tax=Lysinibacillus sp. SGAir0095 TaxID=2070463 RepID=UPI0010CD366E|nr:hypothetical protein [Lysinibacillus sp. SGAir0095]QCR33573.1 hypothetical protein C1N55_16055 [Lysinibacillus sp. SGAir0095]